MGRNLVKEMIRRKVNKSIRYYNGTCYVHEEYDADQIFKIRLEYLPAFLHFLANYF